jgi:hypothetical protein
LALSQLWNKNFTQFAIVKTQSNRNPVSTS